MEVEYGYSYLRICVYSCFLTHKSNPNWEKMTSIQLSPLAVDQHTSNDSYFSCFVRTQILFFIANCLCAPSGNEENRYIGSKTESREHGVDNNSSSRNSVVTETTSIHEPKTTIDNT
jgi:hypothetical protein